MRAYAYGARRVRVPEVEATPPVTTGIRPSGPSTSNSRTLCRSWLQVSLNGPELPLVPCVIEARAPLHLTEDLGRLSVSGVSGNAAAVDQPSNSSCRHLGEIACAGQEVRLVVRTDQRKRTTLITGLYADNRQADRVLRVHFEKTHC